MKRDAIEEAEFVRQIARHQAVLHTYIVSLMPGMDGTDDVLQETNILLWEKRKTFTIGTNFRAWASSIARFKVMEHRRKAARRNRQLFDEALIQQLASDCDVGLGEMDQHLRALDKCLELLDDQQRSLIEHRYYSGTRLQDFSTRCGRPVDSLRVSLFRIRAALKTCIEGELKSNERDMT